MRYRSNIAPPRDLEPAFAHARTIAYANCARHTSLCDPELFEGCGYATHDEAAILCELARIVGHRGCEDEPSENRWLEIGAHTGWTAAHLALGGASVVALDPEYARPTHNRTGDAALFLRRTRENLERAGVADRVELVGQTSAEYIAGGARAGGEFNGVFIDGCHDAPHPLLDAQYALDAITPRGVIAFHDALGAPVQAGVRHLVDAGLKWRLYKTPQLVAVCWRGEFHPPEHRPDPGFPWDSWIQSIFPRDLLARQS